MLFVRQSQLDYYSFRIHQYHIIILANLINSNTTESSYDLILYRGINTASDAF